MGKMHFKLIYNLVILFGIISTRTHFHHIKISGYDVKIRKSE
jgi:hypothetical protein